MLNILKNNMLSVFVYLRQVFFYSSDSAENGINMSDKLQEICDNIGYEFSDQTLLRQALTHSSWASQKVDSNERLEFMGDSILGFCVSEHLYKTFPEKMEGELTELKSIIVSRESLAEAARNIGLDSVILMGKGMAGRNIIPDSLIADAFEALIAAIYLDGGIRKARKFILAQFKEKINRESDDTRKYNYKSLLQEMLQKQSKPVPEYRVTKESGPDHAKTFVIAVYIDGEKYEQGKGFSKKEAEQLAAEKTLKLIAADQ